MLTSTHPVVQVIAIIAITATLIVKYWLAYRAQRLAQEHQTVRTLASLPNRPTTFSAPPAPDSRVPAPSAPLDHDCDGALEPPTTTSSTFSPT